MRTGDGPGVGARTRIRPGGRQVEPPACRRACSGMRGAMRGHCPGIVGTMRCIAGPLPGHAACNAVHCRCMRGAWAGKWRPWAGMRGAWSGMRGAMRGVIHSASPRVYSAFLIGRRADLGRSGPDSRCQLPRIPLNIIEICWKASCPTPLHPPHEGTGAEPLPPQLARLRFRSRDRLRPRFSAPVSGSGPGFRLRSPAPVSVSGSGPVIGSGLGLRLRFRFPAPVPVP